MSTTIARFCPDCGTPVEGAKFCAECGRKTTVGMPAVRPEDVLDDETRASAATGEHADEPTTGAFSSVELRSAAAAEAAPAARGRGRALLAGLGVVLVAAGVVAAVLLSSHKSTKRVDTTYPRGVAAAFGPVLGANREVSSALGRLSGSNPVAAKAAVRRAEQATTAATGALGALSVPKRDQQLATNAHQVLDREVAYLSTVAAILAQPTTSTDQLPTLASNLTSALDAAGPTVAGTSQTVSGSEELSTWAHHSAAVLRARAHRKAARRARARHAASGSSSGSAATASNPYANGRSCGNDVYAGPNTSCDFALNVREAYDAAPGTVATVRAYSPATGNIYTMDCAPSGAAVTCSGGNDASVSFSF